MLILNRENVISSRKCMRKTKVHEQDNKMFSIGNNNTAFCMKRNGTIQKCYDEK